ncbi:L-serine ammonia-lyase, iron-sulfur-dependent, subunit alpha [Clostridium polynesiense]|uniref:L-serine ammonia-lyase, iron-sulfur-dependent, subunit alpha n=1 Tax=Clostridium polynesiense TaxID=1325933 RepID=UPI00058E71DF|nr:L-serine ammonia-lyase, iron-sulfur-dependent, subunit alpha [Clostridium polynesiense]
MFASNGEELIKICAENNITLAEYALKVEMESSGASKEEIYNKMKNTLAVMKYSAEEGMRREVHSVSGLIGGDAYRVNKYLESGVNLTGDVMVKAMARALSSSEVNASMGKIVAAPTAGSCGILPAVILTAAEKLNKDEDEMVNALLASSAVGMIIAKNATLAGAEGGCQAECGSAAAMAAAAVVEMMGGTPEMALNAGAIVIKNILGLVCDPVAGLVEVPCAKRNVAGAVSALTTADLVMAGVMSKIPFDDVVSAMYKIGKAMPAELRETALGGCAATNRGIILSKKIFDKNK